MRTTKRELLDTFRRLCAVIGVTNADESNQRPAWRLEHIAAYGGWKIVELSDGRGESDPFGSNRRSAAEMLDVMRFAQQAIHYDRDGIERNTGRGYPLDKAELR